METGQDKPHFHGHRERLRARFREVGGGGLPDYEFLELLLCRSIARQDVKPVAKALLKRFGSFSEVLAAPMAHLKEVQGVGEQTAFDLKIVEAAALRFAKGAISQREVLSSWNAVLEYCRASMAFADKEQFRILFLDRKNALIADEVQQIGTIDHAPVYPREVVKRALDLAATAIILVHNHPSGDPAPSSADIETTKKIAIVAAPLGIVLHDHLIVGRNGCASLKNLGLI